MKIIIPLSKTVEFSEGNFTDQVELKYIYTYPDRLEFHTSIGVCKIGYPASNMDTKFTEAEMSTPADLFISQVIPEKVKAWAEA